MNEMHDTSQVKKILEGMEGVTLEDEVVLVPLKGSASMRADGLYGANNRLINTNTRMVVAWYGKLEQLPRPTTTRSKAAARRGKASGGSSGCSSGGSVSRAAAVGQQVQLIDGRGVGTIVGGGHGFSRVKLADGGDCLNLRASLFNRLDAAAVPTATVPVLQKGQKQEAAEHTEEVSVAETQALQLARGSASAASASLEWHGKAWEWRGRQLAVATAEASSQVSTQLRLEGPRRPQSPQPHEWRAAVGQRVEVFWSHEQEWYAATVQRCVREETSVWSVLYDDGVLAEERLGGRHTRPLLPATTKQADSAGTAVVTPAQEAGAVAAPTFRQSTHLPAMADASALPDDSTDWATYWGELSPEQQVLIKPPHRPGRGNHGTQRFNWRSVTWVAASPQQKSRHGAQALAARGAGARRARRCMSRD